MSLFISETFGLFSSAIFIIAISMFVSVFSVCVVCVFAVLSVNSTDRPSAIQFQTFNANFSFQTEFQNQGWHFVTELGSVLSVSPHLPVCAHVAARLLRVGGMLGAAHGGKVRF